MTAVALLAASYSVVVRNPSASMLAMRWWQLS
jgi:hypothetical protein